MSHSHPNMVTIVKPDGDTREVNVINQALTALRKAQKRARVRHAGNPNGAS